MVTDAMEQGNMGGGARMGVRRVQRPPSKGAIEGETEEKNLNPLDKGERDNLRAEGASRYEGPEVPALGTVNGHQAGIIGP